LYLFFCEICVLLMPNVNTLLFSEQAFKKLFNKELPLVDNSETRTACHVILVESFQATAARKPARIMLIYTTY
ncbi:MAG: hypothetical protein PHE96_10010, partial [Methylococcales bacterium]|nr:hypothetical protein [Methylococcales bacterium]